MWHMLNYGSSIKHSCRAQLYVASLHEGPARQKVSKQFCVFMLKPCTGRRRKKTTNIKHSGALHMHACLRLAWLQLLASMCRKKKKTLTKVTTNLAHPFIRSVKIYLKKGKKKSKMHQRALCQQRASSSVAIPTYAFKIIKNVTLNKAQIGCSSRLHIASRYVPQETY